MLCKEVQFVIQCQVCQVKTRSISQLLTAERGVRMLAFSQSPQIRLLSLVLVVIRRAVCSTVFQLGKR